MDIENLRTAGKITKKIKEEIPKLIYSEANILDIAETIENLIEEEGAKPAFPVNISINEIAAHYTPSFKETRTVNESDLIKIDFGVLYEDAITDTAVSINLDNSKKELIETAKKALENAIKEIKPGVGNGKISEIIENTIKENNFKPIANLSGHKIEEQNLHAGIDIPNVRIKDTYFFKEGDVFAIEPFVTLKEAEGYVVDKNEVEIYSVLAPSPLRMREARKILSYAFENYGFMPFAERWIKKKFGDNLIINASIKELLKSHGFKAYPVLVEKSGKVVAQAEHTVYITEKGAEVIA